MLGSRNQIIAFSFLSLFFTGIVLFELGMYLSNEVHLNKLNQLRSEHAVITQQSNLVVSELQTTIAEKEKEMEALNGNKDELATQVDELHAQIAGLSTSKNNYPFAVPSTGTVGSRQSTYLDENNGYYHYGIDFWTTTSNGGAINTHRGNPVYSACSGVVESFQPDNGGVTIRCDMIAPNYNVKARKVFTYYGHMANAVTKEQYIYVKIGERVRKGQFIGYQGDLSMFTPEMRNVHLHFSVFSGFKEADGNQDPCKYIGGSCNTVGSFFVSELN